MSRSSLRYRRWEAIATTVPAHSRGAAHGDKNRTHRRGQRPIRIRHARRFFSERGLVGLRNRITRHQFEGSRTGKPRGPGIHRCPWTRHSARRDAVARGGAARGRLLCHRDRGGRPLRALGTGSECAEAIRLQADLWRERRSGRALPFASNSAPDSRDLR